MKDLQNKSWGIKDLVNHQVDIQNGQSAYAKKMVSIWQNATNAYLNLRLRNPNAAEYAAQVLRQARKYEFTEIVVSLSKRLMKYYPYRGDNAKSNYYKNIFEANLKTLNAEALAEKYLCDIDKDIIKKISNQQILEKLKTYISEIDEILYDFHSLDFLLNAYKLKRRLAQLTNDPDLTIQLCDEGMERLQQKKYPLPHVVYIFFVQPKNPIYIQNGEFEKSENLMNFLYKKIKKGTVNWFVIHSYDVIMNFRKLDFEKAGKLIDQFKRYDNPVHRERYQIYAAYLSLFTNRKFQLGKFTNEVFEFSKDREGYRINIIIVQMLHLLKYNKIARYIDRQEAIEQYMHRYLRSNTPEVRRSRYFLKCLLLIPKSNFNKIAFERNTEKLYQQIISGDSDALELEPVRYEYLYQFVKGLLK